MLTKRDISKPANQPNKWQQGQGRNARWRISDGRYLSLY